MRPAHPLEHAVGIAWYVSDADGIGGRLRVSPEDFRVRELEAFEAVSLEEYRDDRGAYPELVVRVHLSNWDTNDFARRLTNALGISRERVSWAGTKDKRAVTTQLMTVRDADPEAVREVADAIDGATIEIVGLAGRPISFGDLAGNAFEIRIRGAGVDDDVADAADDATDAADDATDVDPNGADDPVARARRIADELRAFGRGVDAIENDAGNDASAPDPDDPVAVPNYFGQQRFGSIRPVTHEVGLAIVRGEWREAVRTYVANPSEDEPEDTRSARAFVDEQFASEDPDWTACLERIPRRLRFERAMLHRLDERADDSGTSGADDSGRSGDDDSGTGEANGSGSDESDADSGGRWRHALEAVPSNLQRLFINAAQSYLFNRIVSERLDRGIPFHEPVAGDVVCFADADAPAELSVPDVDRLQRVDEDRVSVMRRHCERNRAFVTAPLVGTDTELAGGEPGEIEREVLSAAGVTPEDFSLPDEFDSSGTRRAILLRTDLSVDDDLRFAFALPSGSYATVLLREFTKNGPLDR